MNLLKKPSKKDGLNSVKKKHSNYKIALSVLIPFCD